MSRSIALPAPVCRLIDRLETEGFDCWIVGGCVRDSLLHKTPSDWDMTTAATPEQMCAIFSDKRLMTNGEKHGTIGVIEDGQVYEITTYRVETGCSDHRHPDSVHFTSRIEEDLSRRDFTINAMAYHPQRGLLDCFGGEDDLRQKVVRCVGEPQLRFEEDALRILRALRFAAALGFLIEPQTLCAMRQKAALLQEISAERIQSELCRTLCAPSAGKVLQLAPEVWSLLLDGLSDWQTHAPSLHNLPADAVLRLCWLYGCEGRSAAPLCRKLRFSAAQIRRAEAIFGCWRQLLDSRENLVFSLRNGNRGHPHAAFAGTVADPMAAGADACPTGCVEALPACRGRTAADAGGLSKRSDGGSGAGQTAGTVHRGAAGQPPRPAFAAGVRAVAIAP